MAGSDSTSREATILIIEDHDDTVTNLQHTGLTGAGYTVRRVGSAREALVTLRSTQADLILMSLMLPDADGLMLCSTLKANFRAPIIILTDRTSEIDRALALESGAIECLTRTVDRDELLALVKGVVQLPLSAQA